MKKIFTIFGVVLFTSISLTSCGGSEIESDYEMFAEYICKFDELSKKKKAGDESVVDEMMKLATEMDSIGKEFKKKYSSDVDRLKFEEAFKKEILKCE